MPSPLTYAEYMYDSFSYLSIAVYFVCIFTESRVVGLLIASIITLKESAEVDITSDVDIEPTMAGTTDYDNSELTKTC